MRRSRAALPRLTLVRQNDTHRLIPSKYGDSVLVRIAEDDAHLRDLFELDNATNERLLAESNLLPGIGIHELVFAVPHYRIVNAAFCHAHPLGSRFNGPDRGAWYAGFARMTAEAEVAFHKSVELAEVGWWEETLTYDDYLADFSAELHDIRDDRRFANCLAANSYRASQSLARRLLAAGGLGIVYASVRHAGGTCLACFRPALVMNVRKGATLNFVWSGPGSPAVSEAGPAQDQ